jgi:hypothetical protein
MQFLVLKEKEHNFIYFWLWMYLYEISSVLIQLSEPTYRPLPQRTKQATENNREHDTLA